MVRSGPRDHGEYRSPAPDEGVVRKVLEDGFFHVWAKRQDAGNIV